MPASTSLVRLQDTPRAQRVLPTPITASAALAALEENEKRFKERVREIEDSLRSSVLDALHHATRSVPRHLALVRLEDTPLYVTLNSLPLDVWSCWYAFEVLSMIIVTPLVQSLNKEDDDA